MGVNVWETFSTSPQNSESGYKHSQPHWRPDTDSDACLGCGKGFSLWHRRHHCRACGELVCADCSPHMDALPAFGYDMPVRVCKRCSKSTSSFVHSETSSRSYSSSDSSSDGEVGAEDDDLLPWAMEIIASHSTHKHTKLSYEYFVRSEAVNWLVDAGVVNTRRRSVSLFTRLVDQGLVTMKPWKGSNRTMFYIINDGMCDSHRLSHYGSAMHSETSKCSNCTQSFLESMTPAPGFCSIDCKTNAFFSEADAARFRRTV